MDDERAVAAQIGRPVRARIRVVRRCSLALPIVVEVPPVLDHGEPFPTRFWLTCPLARRRVSQLEAAGGVRAAEREVDEDAAFGAALAAAHARYAAERDAAVSPAAARRPSGGVGGAARGVKCLHAHLADTLAGNDNPVGARVAQQVGRLACATPCVSAGEERRQDERLP